MSVENMAAYDADLIVLTTPERQPLDPDVEKVLANTSAGRRAQIFHVDTGLWSASNLPGLFSVPDDLERLVGDRRLDVSGTFE